MSKKWIPYELTPSQPKETELEKKRRFKRADKIIAKTNKPSLEDLEKESKQLFEENKIREESLLTAFSEKRLKSKTLIKEAIRLNKKANKNKSAQKEQ